MYNTTRITGLASGIDTEEMIQSMMRAERVKVDKVEQDRQVLLWRQEMYNDLNKSFANFILKSRKNFGLTSIGYNGTFRTNSYQNLNWVKKATSSNESAATVSSTSKAVDGSYDVEVRQLAEGVTMASGNDIKDIFDENGKLKEEYQGLKFTIKDGTKVKDEEGKEKDVGFVIDLSNKDDITMNDVVKAINSAKAKVYNGQQISDEEIKNLTDEQKKDVKELSANVRASYDHSIGRFFIQTTNTGKDAKLQITTDSDEAGTNGKSFIDALNLQYKTEDKDNPYGQYKANAGEIPGRDAVINFNGANDITSPSNHITINGITMDLKSQGKFTVNVGTDVDEAYDKVKEFIDDYNELVEMTNKLLGEDQYRSYKPLTADEKKAMEKEDIKLWEEKAKSGLLRSDDIISKTMQNTRSSIYKGFETKDDFSGKYRLITDIGISTEKFARGSAGGRLVIDEDKFKRALAEDPDEVMKMLFKESEFVSEDKNGKKIKKYEGGGFVARIHDNLMLGMEEVITKSGTAGEPDLYRNVKGSILLDFIAGSQTGRGSISLIEKDVLDYNKRIDDLNVMLFKKENHYYEKFAAMEKAISRMNQQSAWMTQQFTR
jgi:flagellar hook-associated protein 2